MAQGDKLGIWIDHSSAHLIEFSAGTTETKILESKFTHEIKKESLNRSETIMHNKEQQQQHAFYHQIGEVIKKYDEVILFGPTDAKAELYNLLKSDSHFAKINIEIQAADKMTDQQQHAFVKKHFSI